MPDLVWRVLSVSAGAYGSHQLTGISKIVKTVITPLADFKVSVLVISTYQSDYVLVGLEDSIVKPPVNGHPRYQKSGRLREMSAYGRLKI